MSARIKGLQPNAELLDMVKRYKEFFYKGLTVAVPTESKPISLECGQEISVDVTHFDVDLLVRGLLREMDKKDIAILNIFNSIVESA